MRRLRFTLTQCFFLAAALVLAVSAYLVYHLMQTTRSQLLRRSINLRAVAAHRVEKRVLDELQEAQDVVDGIERAVRFGGLQVDGPQSLESAFFNELINHPNLYEIALTHAVLAGYDGHGDARVACQGRWQISLTKGNALTDVGVATRVVTHEIDHFQATDRRRTPQQGLQQGLWQPVCHASDPTLHATFTTAVSKEYFRQALWSDLHYAEPDQNLPETARRVVVTLQKAVVDRSGALIGVVRVGLQPRVLSDVVKIKVNEDDPADPHEIFICDTSGRLISSLNANDRFVTMGDDLRTQPAAITALVTRALKSPVLATMADDTPLASETFEVRNHPIVATFRALQKTQGWVVGIVVPESYYTRDLVALRDRFGLVALVVGCIILTTNVLALRLVRGGFAKLIDTAACMRRFEFAADNRQLRLLDVAQVMESLERAKTALRALSRYVPVDLVRSLYTANREPELGGELRVTSIMFTDIQGFTELSEQLPANVLAQALGAYFAAMTAAIRGQSGTIDKYIGDAVMALWNAPADNPQHAVCLCAAALECQEATDELFASSAWEGQRAWITRFGLHTDDVLVGHFGAPERLSYTALGDGVNLASRLEGLCKLYRVTIIASETTHQMAQTEFAFRRLDRVAVKGKARSVTIYELVGSSDVLRNAAMVTYEAALDLYFAQRFAEATTLLRIHASEDGPSSVLLARCEHFLVTPPDPHWDGVWHADKH